MTRSHWETARFIQRLGAVEKLAFIFRYNSTLLLPMKWPLTTVYYLPKNQDGIKCSIASLYVWTGVCWKTLVASHCSLRINCLRATGKNRRSVHYGIEWNSWTIRLIDKLVGSSISWMWVEFEDMCGWEVAGWGTKKMGESTYIWDNEIGGARDTWKDMFGIWNKTCKTCENEDLGEMTEHDISKEDNKRYIIGNVKREVFNLRNREYSLRRERWP